MSSHKTLSSWVTRQQTWILPFLTSRFVTLLKYVIFSIVCEKVDRRHKSWQKQPSLMIRDSRCMKESTNCTPLLHILYGRWLVGLGVISMILVFGHLICILTRLASSCSIIIRVPWSTHADGIKTVSGYLLRIRIEATRCYVRPKGTS